MAGPATNDDVRAVHLQQADIPACVRLAAASFDAFDGQHGAVARWFEARVVNNPWQVSLPGIGVGLLRHNELVAFRAMFAQPWWLAGQATVVAFAAHTAVDPRCRGQGLGTRLIDASRAFARITGSTTAGDITQKSYRRLGFHAVGGEDNGFFRLRTSLAGSLQSRMGLRLGAWGGWLLDVGLVTRDRRLGSVRGGRLEPMCRCTDEVDRLWERVRAGEVSCLERSSRYLNWRLFDFPTAHLRLSALRDAGGQLQALAVWTTIRYSRFVETAVLRDLVVPWAEPLLAGRMLRLLVAHWRGLGISWASLEVTSTCLQQLFRAQGYVQVPSNGNRYHIHSSNPVPDSAWQGWFRSGLDGDYFDVHTRENGAPT